MIKKSLIPPVQEPEVDLSRINLKNYERCPLCGRKLKRQLSEERLAANRENLKKRREKGGRPRSVDRPPDPPPDASKITGGGDHAYVRESKTTSVPKKPKKHPAKR